MQEKTIYENKNGKIVQFTDRFGGCRYVLFDNTGNYLRDIIVPFAVKDIKELFV